MRQPRATGATQLRGLRTLPEGEFARAAGQSVRRNPDGTERFYPRCQHASGVARCILDADHAGDHLVAPPPRPYVDVQIRRAASK